MKQDPHRSLTDKVLRLTLLVLLGHPWCLPEVMSRVPSNTGSSHSASADQSVLAMQAIAFLLPPAYGKGSVWLGILCSSWVDVSSRRTTDRCYRPIKLRSLHRRAALQQSCFS